MWKQADTTQIRQDTVKFSTEFCLNSTERCVDDMWEEISSHLNSMVENHVPTKQASLKFHQPWVDSKLKKLSRRKHRAWKRAKKSKKPAHLAYFKKLKKQTQKANRNAYYSYVSDMVSDVTDRNKLWRLIKSKKCDSTGVSPLKKEGLTYSDSRDKAELLNDQFCSVFTKEDLATTPDLGSGSYPSAPDIVVSVPGVAKLLQNLNPNKASGPDGISCRLLKMVANEVAPALTVLYNKSLETGIIPQAWKHALVQPIFKKGERSNPANYRPISLTCVCCKMLEHIVRTSVSDHLALSNVLSDAQHGFRKRRSCETQLLLTINDLASTLDNGGQTDVVLLDFEKAFDKVPHQRLLSKLSYYGIRSNTLTWISAFLSERTQEVVVGGQHSTSAPVTSGVPQGSVLGPLLFLVYINDLPHNIKSSIRLFADDTMLSRVIDSTTDTNLLQADLMLLEEWEKRWQMSFNAGKCLLLRVTRKQKPIEAKYILHNQILECVASAKYLGLEIASDLNWGKHIHNCTTKANRASAFAYRNIKGSPTRVQVRCYKGIVRPLMEYASTVWDPHQANHTNLLERVQRRSARRILHNFSRTCSASAMVRQLGLQTLESRRTTAKASMIYKMVNDIVDIDTSHILIKPKRATRGHANKFMVPHTRTNVLLYSFFPSAIRIWNSVPNSVISATTIDSFQAGLAGPPAVDY